MNSFFISLACSTDFATDQYLLFSFPFVSMTRALRYYLDTNVFISAFNMEVGGETGGGYKPLYEYALNLFDQIKEADNVIVLSYFFFEEAKDKHFEKDEILEFFNKIGVIIEEVKSDDKDEIEMMIIKRKYQLHKADSKHTAIALRTGCDIIISFNRRDFKKVKKLIPYIDPSEN